jgi:hypothetical protein
MPAPHHASCCRGVGGLLASWGHEDDEGGLMSWGEHYWDSMHGYALIRLGARLPGA